MDTMPEEDGIEMPVTENEKLKERNEQLESKIGKIKGIVETVLNEMEPHLREYEDSKLCDMLRALREIKKDLDDF